MGDSETKVTYETSTPTVLILFVFLLCLIVILIFLYKKLNKEANGEYTIRRMVYKEGGVRDRVRGAALAVGTRLGVQLWPRSDTDEAEEEMQEIQDEEGQVEGGSSHESDTEGDDEQEEDSMEQDEGKGSDASDDSSSLEDAEAGEQARLTAEPEVKEETKEKMEEKQEKVEEEQAKVEASGGAGLLIDLKQFSGSAIWSEEEGGEGQGIDVTPL